MYSSNVNGCRRLERARGPVYSAVHNGPMTSPEPIRVIYTRGRAETVNRRFLSWLWAFAVTFAVAAFYRPAITAFSVCLPVLVVLWVRALRRAPRPGWVLAVSEEQLVLEGGGRWEIGRPQAAEIRIQGSRKEPWSELVVNDRSGRTRFRAPVHEADLDRVTGALRSRGWPGAV